MGESLIIEFTHRFTSLNYRRTICAPILGHEL